MYINTFKYTPKDVSCQLCTEYVKKLGCTALRCPWLAERIEAGVVGYREAVLETFPHERRLFQRLTLLIKHYPGSLWSNEQHGRRMQYQCAVQGYRRRRDTNAYYAAMYLLTSNDDIYRRTANCFCKDGIEFGYAVLKNTSPHNYALFMAARDLCDKTEAVTMADLAEPEVIDPEALRLIVNATLIARYGLAAFQIRARGAEYLQAVLTECQTHSDPQYSWSHSVSLLRPPPIGVFLVSDSVFSTHPPPEKWLPSPWRQKTAMPPSRCRDNSPLQREVWTWPESLLPDLRSETQRAD